MSEHHLSQRRACQAAGLARSTLRYARVVCDDSGVIDFIQRYVALNPRHGFGLLYASARFQEQPWGKTVLWRVYCQLKLNLPRRGKKRLPQRIKHPLEAASTPNQGWSCDFMSDALWSGRQFRTFNVLTTSTESACVSKLMPACLQLGWYEPWRSSLRSVGCLSAFAWTTGPSSSPRP